MKIHSLSRPIAIWALTDGRAGNRAQALGLAEALARLRPAEIRDLAAPPGRLAAALPAALSHRLTGLLPGWPVRGHRTALPAERPDLVIGAGRRIAPLVAALGRAGARTVQVLDPKLGQDAFDLLVVPEHDGLGRPEPAALNVIETLGAPGRITAESIAAAAAGAWEARLTPLPQPRLAVLLGGSGRMGRWSGADKTAVCAALPRLAAAGWTLMVTNSRRTDPAVATALRQELDPTRHLLHFGEGDNPYPALLGHADAVLVTADSVNMASEAASSGLPLHIFPLSRLSDKARRFHASLADRGIARWFESEIGQWDYAPLAEADRVAALIVHRLGL